MLPAGVTLSVLASVPSPARALTKSRDGETWTQQTLQMGTTNKREEEGEKHHIENRWRDDS